MVVFEFNSDNLVSVSEQGQFLSRNKMALSNSDAQNLATIPAILTRIAGADQSAVQECVELYGKMIWALAKKHTNSTADAERIVPEIFMDIWKNARFCDLKISEEKNWIALIAQRHLNGFIQTDNNTFLIRNHAGSFNQRVTKRFKKR